MPPICLRPVSHGLPGRDPRPVRKRRPQLPAPVIAEPECLFRRRWLARLEPRLDEVLGEAIRSVALPRVARGRQVAGVPRMLPGPRDAACLATALRDTSSRAAYRALDDLRRRGASPRDLLRVMADAESRLRTSWCGQGGSNLEATLEATLEVTLAVCRLRSLAQELVRAHCAEQRPGANASRSVAVVSLCGDMLRFDSMLPECHLRLAGFDVVQLEGLSETEVLAQRCRRPGLDACLLIVNDVRLLGRALALARHLDRVAVDERCRLLGAGRALQAFACPPRALGFHRIVSDPEHAAAAVA